MTEGAVSEFDVVVVGAGFAGLYALHRFRGMGLRAIVVEVADDVGGTWYWNRYPGARCDIVTTDYSYSFDPELSREWTWSEKYATQPEILRYLGHVADRYDLRRDIRFGTRVDAAAWDAATEQWRIGTSSGAERGELVARYYVMASGCLSVPKEVDVAGLERFRGPTYSTGRWPHEGVDFTGQRVAVIGTGSSGIQSIPVIADQAEHLTVFQRTPAYTFPAHNGPVPSARQAEHDADPVAYREAAQRSRLGVPEERTEVLTFSVDADERRRRFEQIWADGELVSITAPYADTLVDPAANEEYAEFVRAKIRETVDDPVTAERLVPTTYAIGTKRPCLDSGYHATFNRPHVDLVDLRETPITTVTESGIDTTEASFEFDSIVLATGFDALTGAIVAVDIRGRDGVSLEEKWADGPLNYLGLMTAGFPNLFLITGPGSPSVFSNMVVSIEQHVDFVADLITEMQRNRDRTVEPTDTAEAGWVQHSNDLANLSLLPQTDSWYMGANVPGKPKVLLAYLGGVDGYRQVCDEVVEQGYLGFTFDGESGRHANDGVIRRIMPDVQVMLDLLAQFQLPPFETLPVDAARELYRTMSAERPPGPGSPDVEVTDGNYPGATGDELAYRLYRPNSPGPHPVVVYFHGGGWVFGDAVSDDPLCRDLCHRSGAAVISVDYRHAPEARFPAAADDAVAALRWVAEHGDGLGLDPTRLMVAGWSAGGNLAAVVSQAARDAGGPALAGQVLLCPVTGAGPDRPSFAENGDGYVLTTGVMRWFWGHYSGPEGPGAHRDDPRFAPLHGDLAGLPPALIVTAEFDPLRDDGAAYAEALAAAGVEVDYVAARGQVHTSIPAVDQLPTGAEYRQTMADAIRRFLSI